MIQQAIAQILVEAYDPHFSNSSYGFRPGRSALEAIEQASRYIKEGKNWVVEMDLEKFFDTVNHDRLMARLAKRIKDKALLKLIGRYLRNGIMQNGLVSPREEGTPQGSNLSPILSLIVLDELDKHLEGRGLSFCRYADDCNLFVSSRQAGERVLEKTIKFIEGTLKLRVNCSKSASFVLRSPNFSDIRSWERQGRRVSLRRALHDLCTSSGRFCVEAAEDPSWERSRP